MTVYNNTETIFQDCTDNETTLKTFKVFITIIFCISWKGKDFTLLLSPKETEVYKTFTCNAHMRYCLPLTLDKYLP